MNGDQERVLVVDDEEQVRNLLQRTLQKAGYSVVYGTTAVFKFIEIHTWAIIKIPHNNNVSVFV